MTDAPQPSHEENIFKLMINFAKMLQKTGFGPLSGPKWPKICILSTFWQKFIDTAKFTIGFYPSNLKN